MNSRPFWAAIFCLTTGGLGGFRRERTSLILGSSLPAVFIKYRYYFILICEALLHQSLCSGLKSEEYMALDHRGYCIWLDVMGGKYL